MEIPIPPVKLMLPILAVDKLPIDVIPGASVPSIMSTPFDFNLAPVVKLNC